jgi:hypothetical protein
MLENLPKVIIELNQTDELSRLLPAATALGDVSIRVLDDPAEARARLRSNEFVKLGRKYEGETAGALMNAAGAIWPPELVAKYIGEGATHKVTELTFTGEHGRKDLYRMATHGYTEGVGGNL